MFVGGYPGLLPTEVLEIIFREIWEGPEVEDDGPEATVYSSSIDWDAFNALCCPSQRSCAIARPMLYHSVSLPSKTGLRLMGRSLTTNSALVPLVQNLEVDLSTYSKTTKLPSAPPVLHAFSHVVWLRLVDFHDMVDNLPPYPDLFPFLRECYLANGNINRLAALKPLWMAPQLREMSIYHVNRRRNCDVERDLELLSSNPVRRSIKWLNLGNIRDLSRQERYLLSSLRRVRQVDLTLYDCEQVRPQDISSTKLVDSLGPSLREFYCLSGCRNASRYVRSLRSMTRLSRLGIEALHLINVLDRDSLPESLVELCIQDQGSLLSLLYERLEAIVNCRDKHPNLRKLKLWCPTDPAHAREHLGPDCIEIKGLPEGKTAIDLSRLEEHQQLKTHCDREGVRLLVEDWHSQR